MHDHIDHYTSKSLEIRPRNAERHVSEGLNDWSFEFFRRTMFLVLPRRSRLMRSIISSSTLNFIPPGFRPC